MKIVYEVCCDNPPLKLGKHLKMQDIEDSIYRSFFVVKKFSDFTLS